MAVDLDQVLQVWEACREPDMSDLDARLRTAQGPQYNDIVNEKNRRRQQASMNCMGTTSTILTVLVPGLGLVAWGITELMGWLVDRLGFASSGPGMCFEPERRPSGPEHPNWKHANIDDRSGYGPYAEHPKNDFERAVQPAILKVWELYSNCVDIDPEEATRNIIKLWNDTHEGPYITYQRPQATFGRRLSPLIFEDILPVSVNMGPAKRPSSPLLKNVRSAMRAGAYQIRKGSGEIGGSAPPLGESQTKSDGGSGLLKGTALVTSAVLGGSAVYALATKQSFKGVWQGWYRKGKSAIGR